MSLRDGTKKMSKSDISDYSRIMLSDTADEIVQKIRKAKTDPYPLPANMKEAHKRPEAFNLISIFASLNNQSTKDVVEQYSGKEFSGTVCSHPFLGIGYDYDIPMFEARFVTIEQGTGIVHCAPSHGPDDFNLCLSNGIKAVETVNDDGKYTSNIPYFEGIHIF